MRKAKRRRPYDASGRRRRAAESQERVLEVARRLFAARGYAETTMEAIAADAGIAVPTLYAAFRSKRGVLDALMHRLVSGEPGAPPLLETAGARAVAAESDPRRVLALFARHVTEVQERVGPIYEVLRHAARTDREMAELLARMQQYRFDNLETIARRLAELGALRAGLAIDAAARTLWLLTSQEARQLLFAHAGWTVERYRAWLEDTLTAALLAGPARPTARRRTTS
jgi:TetR/AcrR family transcriptional regulator of autoinduction and epiphytic fitness